jgi:hypothetical protein
MPGGGAGRGKRNASGVLPTFGTGRETRTPVAGSSSQALIVDDDPLVEDDRVAAARVARRFTRLAMISS